MESSLLVISFNFMFCHNCHKRYELYCSKFKDTATISERQLQCRKVLWGGSLSQSSEPFLNEADADSHGSAEELSRHGSQVNKAI